MLETFWGHFYPWKRKTNNPVLNMIINVPCSKILAYSKNLTKTGKLLAQTLKTWNVELDSNISLSLLSSGSCFLSLSFHLLHSAWLLSPNGSLHVAARQPQHSSSSCFHKNSEHVLPRTQRSPGGILIDLTWVTCPNPWRHRAEGISPILAMWTSRIIMERCQDNHMSTINGNKLN